MYVMTDFHGRQVGRNEAIAYDLIEMGQGLNEKNDLMIWYVYDDGRKQIQFIVRNGKARFFSTV